ncbi:hypothetical protein [Desulforhopalus singaporensis]|nr:hypothetical protein [Desulforhopalus singaporensis]
MKAIFPEEIELAYTNVPANAENEWANATTYNAGDRVKVTDQEPHRVYKSLRNNNTNKYPPENIEPQVIET